MRKTHLLVLLLSFSFLFSAEGISFAAAKREIAVLKKATTDAPIFLSKNFYNGSFAGQGYDGMVAACDSDIKGAQPCDDSNVLKFKFWRYRIFEIGAWVLNPSIACLAGTTNSTDVLGTCVFTAEDYGNQVTQCSCNMIIPVCCVKP
jgi:hypothetical protein